MVEEYLSFLTNGSQAHTTLVLFIVLHKWTGRPEGNISPLCAARELGRQEERPGMGKKRKMLRLAHKICPKVQDKICSRQNISRAAQQNSVFPKKLKQLGT